MKRIIALLIIFLLAFPLASIAGEPAWWTQKKRECGLPPSLAYNTWVSQGMPCNKGGSSSGGLTPQQNLGLAIGQALGQAIGQSLRGDPEADARRKAEEEARAAEESRRAEEELLKRHEEMKNRLLNNMMNVGHSSQLGLMGVDSGSGLNLMTDDLQVRETRGLFGQKELKPILGEDSSSGAINTQTKSPEISLLTDQQMTTGTVPLLRQPGEIENQKGSRYIDYEATRQFYDRASRSLSAQKDAIERARAQIDAAKNIRGELSKELRKVLLKSAFDTARDMVSKSEMVQEQINDMLKQVGLSDKQRKYLSDAKELLNSTSCKIEKGIKTQVEVKVLSAEAMDHVFIKFPEEFKQAEGFKESFLAVNKLLAESGIYEEGGKMLAETGFGPMGILIYDASKLSLDAGVTLWEKDVINENDLFQAQNTYDNLKYQLSQMQEKLDNARSDLAQNKKEPRGAER